MKRTPLTRTALCIALATCGLGANAADWSDTSIGFRTGSKFAEPFNNTDISKKIVNLNHVSGYKYGSNFFNADMLMSDKNDPNAVGSSDGAHEVYVAYRHTLDLGKITGSKLGFGPFRGFGITGGFDYNTKTDAGYNSKKRMAVLGPTVFLDVPGFLNVSVLQLWESNAPYNGFSKTSTPRFTYKTHPMLTAAWGIPIGPFSFEGFANIIASKGKNEFGGDTAAETNFDGQLMYDLSPVMGASKNTFKIGLEYQYWKNKFGNNSSGAAGKGAFAKTPMIRAEYHF